MYHTTYLYVSIDQINSTRSNIGFTEAAYSQVPRVPTWSDLTRSHLGVLRSSILPIAPRWLM